MKNLYRCTSLTGARQASGIAERIMLTILILFLFRISFVHGNFVSDLDQNLNDNQDIVDTNQHDQSLIGSPKQSNQSNDQIPIKSLHDQVKRTAELQNDTSDNLESNSTTKSGEFSANQTTETPAKSSAAEAECRLIALDPYIHTKIRNRIDHDKVNLIEYYFTFPNYTSNPLMINATYVYKPYSWARVSTRHGQTLLSLAFNYGVLSLMTLTFGTETMEIELMDEPAGCIMWERTEQEKVDLLLYPIVRDFQDVEEIALTQDERVCVERIEEVWPGKATVKDLCYMKDITGELVTTETWNLWITFLYVLMTLIRFGTLFFGPMLLIPAVAQMSNRNVPYLVCLEPVFKTIQIVNASKPPKDKKNILDFSNVRGGFPKLLKLAQDYPQDTPLKAKIDKYDILVDYSRLIPENEVPVGFWQSIMDAIFLCKIQDTWPFRDCCDTKIFDKSSQWLRKSKANIKWIKFWKPVGLLLLVLFIPIPYYIRMIIFYQAEYEEVMERKEAIAHVGLSERYENSFVHFLLPTHPIFILCYVLYALMVIFMAVIARHGDDGRFKNIITGAFEDLGNLSWVKILQMVTKNVIWPFKHYGMLGCAVALIYLPIVLPITLLTYGFYALPTFYVTSRMFFYSRRAFVDSVHKTPGIHRYKVTKPGDTNLKRFLFEKQFNKYFGLTKKSLKSKTDSKMVSVENASVDPDHDDLYDDLSNSRGSFRPRSSSGSSQTTTSRVWHKESWCKEPHKTLLYLLASGICTSTLYASLFLFSECIGCIVEMMVFTLMGIIVNAGTLLKYVSLGVLVIAYSFDCFNNVNKKYLKLNKALFSEVKFRIKDLDKVTSLPSNIQENRGFKSQEQSEQGAHESPDELIYRRNLWKINDLTLFVDSRDMPRVPRRLFDEVCKIRVAGVPGPIYLGLLEGFTQFLKIIIFIMFVFIVVLSFGEVYKVSSTNQMLATMAGGFLPVILRQFMQPERPDIEIGTVSFKTKLDETIKNFYQFWPIHDFQFECVKEGEENKENKNDSSLPNNNAVPAITVSSDTQQLIPMDDGGINGSFSNLADGDSSYYNPPSAIHSKKPQRKSSFQEVVIRVTENNKLAANRKQELGTKSEMKPLKSAGSSYSDCSALEKETPIDTGIEVPQIDLYIILPQRFGLDQLDNCSCNSGHTYTSKH